MDDVDAASFVRSARDKLGMTQTGFGALLGLSLATIKRYESGSEPVPETVRLSLVTILSLAERLKAE
jgi:transcriptional regulator with XRE-family HTH domain